MLPPLRPRQYSISSSPLVDSSSLKLTWSLITHTPPASLPDEPPARGLASHYLAGLKAGDTLKCQVRRGNPRFKPDEGQAADQSASKPAPMIMVCAGSGIAPFRAFVEHRAESMRRGGDGQPAPAPALLYVGIRSPAHAMYASELKAWEASGAVEVRYAYSRGGGEAAGHHGHVQDRIWADREELCRLWEEDGARVYVCGGRGVSHGVREVAREAYREQAEKRCGPKADADVEAWWVEALRERYVVEIF